MPGVLTDRVGWALACRGTYVRPNRYIGTWTTSVLMLPLSRSGIRRGLESRNVRGPQLFLDCRALPYPRLASVLLTVAVQLTWSISQRRQTRGCSRALLVSISLWTSCKAAQYPRYSRPSPTRSVSARTLARRGPR
jgi:hypothetical protein